MNDTDFAPKLRIFFSVDIIGSTLYKNQHDNSKVQPWLPFFYGFYNEFPIVFRSSCDKLKEKREHKCTDMYPELWKSLGDELLFYSELRHHAQAIWLVSSFKDAIEIYNKNITEKYQKNDKPYLSLKGTTWIAGFPVGNAEIYFRGSQGNTSKIDFIGPSIDIGFRLSKFSSSSKLIISCDLAILLTFTTTKFDFCYGGRQVLKGVIQNEPYPIIWLKVKHDNLDEREEGLIQPCNVNSLKEYCEKFIKEIGSPLQIPFMEKDTNFCIKPENYNECHKKIISVLRDNSQGAK